MLGVTVFLLMTMNNDKLLCMGSTGASADAGCNGSNADLEKNGKKAKPRLSH